MKMRYVAKGLVLMKDRFVEPTKISSLETSTLDEMQKKLLDNYYEKLYEINRGYGGIVYPNNSDEDNFFPSCLPFIFDQPTDIQEFPNEDCKKYYHPLRGLPVSKHVYDRIICFPITEGIND